MGKIARRATAVGAFILAGAFALGASAFAAPVDGDDIDIDDFVEIEIPGGPLFYRFAGADRVSTAIQAAERSSAAWGNTAIIASSESYTDALAAAPLADVVDAPVLLNANGDSLRADVLAYLEDGEFERVILVGGTDVFSNAVVTQLEGDYTVERLSGSNRYQTALELAAASITEGEAAEPGYAEDINVFLASGQDFADALSAGPAAAANNGVVLLTVGDQGLDAVTYAALTEASGLEHNSIAAIGGPAAAAAANGAVSGSGLDPVEVDETIVGANRYETALEVAETYTPDAVNFVVASGENFPDAVVGGAYAANVDGALLLTKQESLTQAVGSYFEDRRLDVERVFVFGGPSSVAKKVSQQIADLDWRY